LKLLKHFRNNVIRAGLGALCFGTAHLLLRPIFSRRRRDLHAAPSAGAARGQIPIAIAKGTEILSFAMLAYSLGIDIIAIDAVHRLASGADAYANPGIKGSGWDSGAR
jgi:hypothetical protein